MGIRALLDHTAASEFSGGQGKESEGVSMWNLLHVSASTRTDNRPDAHRQPRIYRQARARHGLLLLALMTLLPLSFALRDFAAPAISALRFVGSIHAQACRSET